MNKEKVINYLKDLNKTEVIKIQNSDKTRRIFKQSNKVFNIFGAENKRVLNPFNDYTYKWLNSFLNNVINLLNSSDFDNFDDLSEQISEDLTEWAESEVSIYTSDLTEWLNDNNLNVYYLTEAIEEYNETDGFKNLQIAQFKAIEEHFNTALNCLIEHLKEEFREE